MSDQNETVITVDEGTPESFLEMQMKILLGFRDFFTPEGLSHFDIALRNREIMFLTSEIEERDRIIEALREPEDNHAQQGEA